MRRELEKAVGDHGGVLIAFTDSYEIVSKEAGKENAITGE